MPKVPVKTIALYFRSSYIIASDLKIFYEPLDVWHGEEDKALFEITTACLNENCKKCMVSNLFDDSIYSFFVSNNIAECRKNPNKHLKTTFEVLHHLIYYLFNDFVILKNPINFYAITLHKIITGSGDPPSKGGLVIEPTQHCCSPGITTFNKACLVLDDDIDNQLCTDAAWGWSYDDWKT